MAPTTSNYGVEEQDGPADASVTLLDQRSETTAEKEKDATTKEVVNLVGLVQLFRYADKWEKLMMVVGSIFNLAYGIPYPFFLVIWGGSFNSFMQIGRLNRFIPTISEFLKKNNLTRMEIIQNPMILNQSLCSDIYDFYKGNTTCTVSLHEGLYDNMSQQAVYFCLLGCNCIVSGYIGFSMWLMASERQANRIRRSLLSNVLRQDIGWFDTNNVSEINNRLSEDVVKIQDGIGDKLGTSIQWVSASISCFCIGVFYGWKYALVVLAVSPILVIMAGGLGKLSASLTIKECKEYAKAGGIASEVFSSIRTVVAFGGQDKAAIRYHKNLDSARRYGIKKSITHGVTIASFNMALYFCEGLSFWYGGKLHREEPADYSPKNILIVFACIMTTAYFLGNAAPGIQALTTARGVAYEVFRLIELKSPIDSMSEEGKRPAEVKGIIQFKNVHFSYPARPDVKVLSDVNLDVLPGQTVAFVGMSGCSKSTTVQLLLRFYDPEHGEILFDGCNIKELNVKWLRKNIGLVSQEPVLFATTIAENIRYGREDVSLEEIIAATKDANAYDFIMQLPEKFETFVGERGAQLSGGQKQRIAIARALVRDPKVLLLDEATSSLDTESESIVQDALEKACKGRTTLIIAHRLSTIRHADFIIGYQDGHVMETGTHDNLMEQRGIYYQLVMNQMITADRENDEDVDDKMNSDITSNKRLDQKLAISESEKREEDDTDADTENLPNSSLVRFMKMNASEWYYIVLGCVGAIGSGSAIPASILIFTGCLHIFVEDTETQKEEFLKYALYFVGLGIACVLTGLLQSSMFGLSGEALTVRLRDQTFRAMMKQNISWFDDPKNGVGALTTRLSTDSSQVQGVTGVRAGVVCMIIACMIESLLIAFGSSWKMTLVLLAFLPFFVFGDFIKVKMFAGQALKNKEAFEGAGKMTDESISNIRTVASLSREETFFSLYTEKIKGPYKAAMRNAHIVGIIYGVSQTTLHFFYAASFVFGAYLIEKDDMTVQDFFRVMFAVMFGAMGLGTAASFAPDLGKARVSAKRIIHILDSKPSIDHTNPGGVKLTNNFTATVSLKAVHFHHMSRYTVPVLQELNLSVSPGQTLALVGSSGCGKSTTVQLIERFYDTVSGMVCLDNHDIKTLNVEWLRSQMALVPQEPVLFDQTIAENIACGDNSRHIPMEDIVEAARTANIHNFITSLPGGYDTNVGASGAQLSGGQRQRVAIARALIGNPRILLLDEATSSLDSESEKIVQEALDRARAGRTCITIAHRLATVQNADKICVIKNGTVTEEGTHNELMAMKGFYNTLVEKSMRT